MNHQNSECCECGCLTLFQYEAYIGRGREEDWLLITWCALTMQCKPTDSLYIVCYYRDYIHRVVAMIKWTYSVTIPNQTSKTNCIISSPLFVYCTTTHQIITFIFPLWFIMMTHKYKTVSIIHLYYNMLAIHIIQTRIKRRYAVRTHSF